MRIAPLALAAMLAIGANARAADDPTVQERINISKYDLNKPADAKAVLSRIEGAALDVCGAPVGTSTEVVWETMGGRCYQDAVRQAVQSTHNEVLFAAFEKRHGSRRAPPVTLAAR